jgi:hypothetical protein
MNILFKVDVTNESQVISKDHGMVIKAGTEIDFDPVPERVEKFIKMGICAAAAAESSQETDPEPPADPESESQDQDPEIKLEDLTKAELESFIKENELDVEIPKKATKPEIIDLIEAALKK